MEFFLLFSLLLCLLRGHLGIGDVTHGNAGWLQQLRLSGIFFSRRKMAFVRVCLPVTLAVCLAGPVSGNEVMFTHYSEKDGVASNFVNCVWQSPEGYIWLGTDNGLQRFDGNKFVRFLRDRGKETLPSMPVLQIIGDKRGHMWLNMGLSVGIFDLTDYSYKQARVAVNIPDVYKYEQRIFCDSKGNLFLIIRGWGILVYNPATRTFGNSAALMKIPSDFRPLHMAEDTTTGDYYITGSGGVGICRKGVFYTAGHNPLRLPLLQALRDVKNVTGIAVMQGGEFFAFQSGLANAVYKWTVAGGLSRLQLKPGRRRPVAEATGMLQVGGDIWVYGKNVFNLKTGGDPEFDLCFDDSDPDIGMRFYEIRQVCPDRDGNTWVATDNGLYLATQINNTIRHGRIPSFKTTEITGVYPLSGQKIAFAAKNGNLEVLQYDKDFRMTADMILSRKLAKTGTGRQEGTISCIYEQSDHRFIWLAWTSGRLARYDAGKGITAFLPGGVLNNEQALCIAERPGGYFFLTATGKIFKHDKSGFRIVADLKTPVHKAMQDSVGHLWIAARAYGLFLYDLDALTILRQWSGNATGKSSLTDNNIRDIAQINDTFYAVAATANLNIINKYKGEVKQYTAYEGLPVQVITALKAEDGVLWMSTTGGICRFVLSAGEFRLYDQRDGLINTANSATLLNACAKLQDNSLVFSGDSQFLLFKPSGLRDLKRPKNVTITDVRILNTYLPLDSLMRKGVLEMEYSRSTFTIMFSSLSFAQGNKLTYYYKMDGAEDRWIKAEANTRASFVSLGPGKYTFRVKCVNLEGQWSERETLLPVYIRPAFYQTWWFILILVLLGIVPVYLIYRSKIRRLLEVQRLREKVARDLHDDMGSTLTSISILSEVAGSRLEGDINSVRSYLDRISHNSQEMMDAMDDIVWAIKPANDTLPRIVARMREYTANVLEAKNILYSFEADSLLDNAKLDMEARRNLFLVFKEALNNIAKYAEAGFVKISIAVNRDHLQLRIQDDGVGFATDDENAGNGIDNMRSRIIAVGGKFELESAESVGTRILVMIPLTD